MLQQLLVSSTSKTELSICFVRRRGASVVQTAPLLAWDSGVPRSYIGWRNSVSMRVNFVIVSRPRDRSVVLNELLSKEPAGSDTVLLLHEGDPRVVLSDRRHCKIRRRLGCRCCSESLAG